MCIYVYVDVHIYIYISSLCAALSVPPNTHLTRPMQQLLEAGRHFANNFHSEIRKFSNFTLTSGLYKYSSL